MPADKLASISDSLCLIQDGFKRGGRLMTSKASVFPTPICKNLQQWVFSIGLTPVLACGPDTQDGIQSAVMQVVGSYAERAGHRTGSHGCMDECETAVCDELQEVLDNILFGTQLTPAVALPFTPADDTDLKSFLTGYKGHGDLCTSLDKAANTIIVQCPTVIASSDCTNY